MCCGWDSRAPARRELMNLKKFWPWRKAFCGHPLSKRAEKFQKIRGALRGHILQQTFRHRGERLWLEAFDATSFDTYLLGVGVFQNDFFSGTAHEQASETLVVAGISNVADVSRFNDLRRINH